METIDLSILQLVIVYGMLIIPFAVFLRLECKLVRSAFISILRMTVQLTVVGFYLGFLFELNNPWLNLLWLSVMLLVANINIINDAGLTLRRFFVPVLIGVGISTGIVFSVFILGAIRPQPLYDARYLIPLAGMILGNCLKGNILALERFYSAISKNNKEFSTYLFMGASLQEAVAPFFKAALKASVTPHIATMATLGIVSLPGMMTGQILGGSFPMVAIKYQMAIMIAIFCAMTLSAFMNIKLSMKTAFDEYQNLRSGVIKGL